MSRFFEIVCCVCRTQGGSAWVEDREAERNLETQASEGGWINYADEWYCPHCAPKDIPQ